MVAAGDEEPPAAAQEPLKYQTWVLKVSIHCEGCKRMVKRVLQSIEGVYTTVVDERQHKVTVVGDVDADTLIKKLLKNGKHAKLWPEEPPMRKKEREHDSVGSDAGKGFKGEGDKKKPADENATATVEQLATNITEPSSTPTCNASAKKPSAKGGDAPKGPPEPDGKKGESSPSPQGKQTAGGGAEGEEKGGGSKKKGKKGRKEADGGDIGEASQVFRGANGGADVQLQVYPHFSLHPQPPPVYAVSYSTAHPSTSYGPAYYAAAPVVVHDDYHMDASLQQQNPAGCYPPPAGVIIPPSDEGSCDVSGDEDANACHVM